MMSWQDRRTLIVLVLLVGLVLVPAAARALPIGGGHAGGSTDPGEEPPPVISIGTGGLGSGRDISYHSQVGGLREALFRTPIVTINARATRTATGKEITSLAVTGSATVTCDGPWPDRYRPQPRSVATYPVAGAVASGPSSALTVSHTIRVDDFPCALHTRANVRFLVSAQAVTESGKTVTTPALALVYVDTFNVMTWNIAGGVRWPYEGPTPSCAIEWCFYEGLTDGQALPSNDQAWMLGNLEEIARVLEEHNVDIALLQEVRRSFDSWTAFLNEPLRLQSRTGMYTEFFVTGTRGRLVTCGFWDYGDEGPCAPDRAVGFLVLSRFPILNPRGVTVTSSAGIQRQAQVVDVDVAGTAIRIVNTHLWPPIEDDPDTPNNEAEETRYHYEHYRELVDALYADGASTPIVLGGDLNTGESAGMPEDHPMLPIATHYRHVCDHFDAPARCSVGGTLDHLYLSRYLNPRLWAVDGRMPAPRPGFSPLPDVSAYGYVSDHLPLVARLTFTPPTELPLHPPADVLPRPRLFELP